MSETYSVVVSGQLVDGFNREQVGQNLQKAFKLAPTQVEKLLCGKPVALKRGLERTAAVKLSERLQGLGAVSMVKASAVQAAPKADKPKVAKPSAAKAAAVVSAEPAAKPVAEPKPVSASESPAAPSEKPVAAPAASAEGESIECPRCGHEQAFTTVCGFCKMDLTMHIRRLERRAKVVDQIRKQRQS